jgi:hypothetical protein
MAEGRTKARVSLICDAIDAYQQDSRETLSEKDGFGILTGDDKYIRTERAFLDEWGRRIEPIVQDGAIVGVISFGADGSLGSVDDIACRIGGS